MQAEYRPNKNINPDIYNHVDCPLINTERARVHMAA